MVCIRRASISFNHNSFHYPNVAVSFSSTTSSKANENQHRAFCKFVHYLVANLTSSRVDLVIIHGCAQTNQGQPACMLSSLLTSHYVWQVFGKRSPVRAQYSILNSKCERQMCYFSETKVASLQYQGCL